MPNTEPLRGVNDMATPAKRLAFLCLLLSVLLPITLAVQWVFYSSSISGTLLAFGQLTMAIKAVVVFVSFLPVLLMAVALLTVRKVALVISEGEYFSARSIGLLRRFAQLVFASALAGIVVPIAIDLVVSLANGGGSVRVAIGSQSLVFALFAAVVWLLARLLSRAATIAEENAQFV